MRDHEGDGGPGPVFMLGIAVASVALMVLIVATTPARAPAAFLGPSDAPDGGWTTGSVVFTEAPPVGEIMRVSWPGGAQYPTEHDPITVSWAGVPVMRCGPLPAGCVVLPEDGPPYQRFAK